MSLPGLVAALAGQEVTGVKDVLDYLNGSYTHQELVLRYVSRESWLHLMRKGYQY